MNIKAILTEDYELYIVPLPKDGCKIQRESEAKSQLATHIFGSSSTIAHNDNGSPYIKEQPDKKISLSHSSGHCALTVSKNGGSIGVDIETARTHINKVADKFIRKDEAAAIGHTKSDNEQTLLLLRYWTAKEAIYKAAMTPGLGLKEIIVEDGCLNARARHLNFSIRHHAIDDNTVVAVAVKINGKDKTNPY